MVEEQQTPQASLYTSVPRREHSASGPNHPLRTPPLNTAELNTTRADWVSAWRWQRPECALCDKAATSHMSSDLLRCASCSRRSEIRQRGSIKPKSCCTANPESNKVARSSLRSFGSFGGLRADSNPFQAMDRMMLNMGNNMQELQRNFGQLSMDPNGHSFCSSSVMTYSKIGDEPPKVFQAATQTRMAPGGIKETRRAMRDSDSGLEKMAVGHHIQDRAHVIKKCKNSKTGDEEVNQEFFNMSESDAHAFDDEWQSEVLKYNPGGRTRKVENTRMRSVGHENAGSRELKRREKSHHSPALESGRKSKAFVDKLNIKGSPVKINKK